MTSGMAAALIAHTMHPQEGSQAESPVQPIQSSARQRESSFPEGLREWWAAIRNLQNGYKQ